MTWHRNVWAKSYAKASHPWDVNAQGEVVHISGEAHGYDWSAIYWLDVNGNRKVEEHWRTHQKAAGGEWYGTPASSYTGGSINYSLIALKSWGRCDLRSWSMDEYTQMDAGGNGGTRRGKWPMDLLYSGPCDPAAPNTDGPGYTGYVLESCCPVYGGSTVCFDRRNGNLFLGLNMKSVGPTGSPDFEPAVVAMDAQGALVWWSRLYHEITPQGDTMISIPDQYVGGLAVDYSLPEGTGFLTVAARSHGNNTENLWEGNTIAMAPQASGFQNQFSCTTGDIHLSWLGKLRLSDGTLRHSTYVGEYSDATPNLGPPHSNPLLDGWPDPNRGWPNLNTTYITKNMVRTTADGSVCVIGEGRRTITTSNAYQKMVKPTWGGLGTWNHFVRVYEPDLSLPRYSSLLTGVWDTLDGSGGGNVTLQGLWKTADGVVAVGYHEANANKVADGAAMPVNAVPAWGNAAPMGESGVLAFFPSETLQNPADGPGVITQSSSMGKHHGELQLYPNPAVGTCFIASSQSGTLQIWDSRVRCMLVQELKDAGIRIDLSDWATGVYWVKQGNSVARLVVLPQGR